MDQQIKKQTFEDREGQIYQLWKRSEIWECNQLVWKENTMGQELCWACIGSHLAAPGFVQGKWS